MNALTSFRWVVAAGIFAGVAGLSGWGAEGDTNAIPKSVFVRAANGRDPFTGAGGESPVPVPVSTNICDTVRVSGVVESKDGGKMALVLNTPLRAGESAKLKCTDNRVREWLVKEIRDKEVVLQSGDTVCVVPIAEARMLPFEGKEKGK